MSLLRFEGTVNISLPWNSSPISTKRGSPPPAQFNDSQSTAAISPDNSPIIWSGNVPPILQGLSVSDFINFNTSGSNPFTIYTLNRTIVNTVTSGIQQSEDFGKPLIKIYIEDVQSFIYDTDIESLEWLNKPCEIDFGPREEGYLYPFNNQNPQGSISLPQINETTTVFRSEVQTLQALPWNQCGQCPTVNPACENRNVQNFTLASVMNVSLTVTCSTGPELDSNFCSSFCTFNDDNLKTCYPDYRNYCLVNPLNPADINIFTNQNCLTFFEDYFSRIGPNATLDNDLENACSAKFPFPSIDAYDIADRNAQNFCACHLPE